MMRTQISLTEDQRRSLDEAARRTGRSISSLIREAVDSTFGSGRSSHDDLAALRGGFGAWSDRDLGGSEQVERMRTASRLQRTS